MATIIGTGLESYLHRQAREQAINRIAEAREEASRILQQAEERAKRIRDEVHEQVDKELQGRRHRVLARARLEAKQILIQRREELIARVWDQAATRLRNLSDPEQRLASLRNLIEDAARDLGAGPLQIQVNTRDSELLNDQVLQELRETLGERYGATDLSLAVTPTHIWGGAIVRRLGSNQLVDNSLEQRLALAKRTLRNQVYHILTTGAESPL